MLRLGENNWPSGITVGDARGHHQTPILLLFFQMKCDSRPCRERVGRLGVGNSPEPITTARPTGKVVSRPRDPGSSPTGSRNVSLVRRQAAFSRPPSVARLFHHRPRVEIPHRLWLHPPTPCWQVADRRTAEAKSPDRVEGLAAGRHARELYAEPFGHWNFDVATHVGLTWALRTMSTVAGCRPARSPPDRPAYDGPIGAGLQSTKQFNLSDGNSRPITAQQ